MTAHRAALPATTDFSGMSHHNFRAAGTAQGMRQASQFVPAQFPAEGMGRVSAQSTATCLLGPRPESVKTGREFTRATLREWGIPELNDLAELVVSELVTNALRHGIPSARKLAGENCVRLRLLAQAPFVMCMVTDPGADIPILREPGHAAESGRGLNVVESCSVRWGWHLIDQDGKVVWALLRPPL
jgi:anti-sigma regulatory factor (Ser/Thr protein kinase)